MQFLGSYCQFIRQEVPKSYTILRKFQNLIQFLLSYCQIMGQEISKSYTILNKFLSVYGTGLEVSKSYAILRKFLSVIRQEVPKSCTILRKFQNLVQFLLSSCQFMGQEVSISHMIQIRVIE